MAARRPTGWRLRAFGLVDASRRPKRAPITRSAGVSRIGTWFSEDQQKRVAPACRSSFAPTNAAATIDECLASLEALTYPDFGDHLHQR